MDMNETNIAHYGGVAWIVDDNREMILYEQHGLALFDRVFKHHVTIDVKYHGKYTPMYKWIKEHIVSDGLWTNSNRTFMFEYKEDAMAFKMRWI